MAALPPILDSPQARVARNFLRHLREHGLAELRRSAAVTTLQVNVGKVCNQACLHCHVEAGPRRTEQMSQAVADRVLHLIDSSPALRTLDLTGGAPELNPHFRRLALAGRARGLRVIDRCNLTVLSEPGQEDLAEFLAANRLEIVASLPCYTSGNVDAQRGRGVFDRSIAALQQLNQLGYAQPGTGLVLNLVYNPLGATLPPAQAGLEADYKRELHGRFGILFDHLFTLTNMPIKRFAEALQRSGQTDAYMDLLANRFNPATVDGLMCRSLLSIGWDGRLFDCDFNGMLDLGTPGCTTVFDLRSLDELSSRRIQTGSHCFGCTAGAGSSCGGSLEQ